MKTFNRYRWGLVALVCISFALTLAISIKYPIPIGSDIHFHINVARIWARGENGGVSDYVLNINWVPYPPLFHWLLVPFVWLQKEFMGARILQTLIYPTAVATNLWFLDKHAGEDKALYMGVMMVASLAFYDSLIQAIPQGIEMILLPFAVDFYLGKRWKPFVAVATAMIWTHSVVSAALLGGILLHALWVLRMREVVGVALTSLPILLPWIHYASAGIGRWTTYNTQQEIGFWNHAPIFLINYLGPLLITVPLLLYGVSKYPDKLNKASLLTLLTTLVIFPLWPVRCLQYLTLPLSYGSSRHINKYLVIPMLPLIALLLFKPWIWLFTNQYYVRGLFE